MNKLLDKLLYLYAFIIPFEYWNPFGLVGSLSVIRIVAILYLVLSILLKFSYVNHKSTVKFIYPIAFFFTYLLIINSFSVFNTIPFKRSIFNLALLQNIFLYYLFMNHFSHNIIIVNKVLFYYCLGIVLLGFLYYFDVGVVYRQGRLSIFGDNPNNQGTKVAFAILFLIYFYFKDIWKLRKLKFIYLLPIPLLFQFILETGSRGALITMFIGAILILFFNNNKWYFNWFYAIIGVIILVNAFNMVTESEVIADRINNINDLETLGGRTEIWKQTFNIFIESPLFGVGEDYFSYSMTKIYGSNKSAHNYFLYILVTTGIIGLSLFTFFLYRIFHSTIKLFRIGDYFYVILFFEIMFAMFRQGGTLGDKFYWFLFSLICGVYILNLRIMKQHGHENSIIY